MASGPRPHGDEPEIPVASGFIPPDSFKTEYHPRSGRPTVIDRFSAFTRTASLPELTDGEPWRSFQSETDFEFAELTHQAALNKEQTEALLHIIWKISSAGAKFTFKTYSDVCAAWQNTTEQLTPVSIGTHLRFSSCTNSPRYLPTCSSKIMLFPFVTRSKTSNLICIQGHCGIGPWISLPTHFLPPILFGMPSICTSTMGLAMNDSLMSHGQPIVGGESKYAHSIICSYIVLKFMYHSLHYLLIMESLLCLSCMLIRHGYHHLALSKPTRSSLDAGIYRLN